MTDQRIDERRRVIIVELEDDDGYFTEYEIPAQWGVCPRCDGCGVHDHEAFSDGFCGSEEWCDQDFLEDYRRGHYDVQCSVCRGRTTVMVPDEERADPKILARYHETLDADAASRAESEAERRMGA